MTAGTGDATARDSLDLLERTLQREAELAARAVRAAVNALVRGDGGLADEVIAFDDDVDTAYLEVQNGVHALLSRLRLGPDELRLALAMLHVNLHVERMADYAVTIAKLVKIVVDNPRDARMLSAFEEMGSRAEEMIRLSLDSFHERDVARAESLVDLDELIDRGNRRVVERILDLGPDRSLREWGLRMLIVSRCLERIGDHAVDVGEQTAYLVTAEFREFTDASHPSDERLGDTR
jgi:phosphate transport system protein